MSLDAGQLLGRCLTRHILRLDYIIVSPFR